MPPSNAAVRKFAYQKSKTISDEGIVQNSSTIFTEGLIPKAVSEPYTRQIDRLTHISPYWRGYGIFDNSSLPCAREKKIKYI
ncbi:hypothetical protein KSC_027480 [Ktedonobacter sp. SOSP1-52]|nr:hypothetical protein KSC_027480 [Ktedonobacter sp. SOSP1-52]